MFKDWVTFAKYNFFSFYHFFSMNVNLGALPMLVDLMLNLHKKLRKDCPARTKACGRPGDGKLFRVPRTKACGGEMKIVSCDTKQGRATENCFVCHEPRLVAFYIAPLLSYLYSYCIVPISRFSLEKHFSIVRRPFS
jgi:hypothetical protein